jgi:hypothetical protein
LLFGVLSIFTTRTGQLGLPGSPVRYETFAGGVGVGVGVGVGLWLTDGVTDGEDDGFGEPEHAVSVRAPTRATAVATRTARREESATR